MECGKFASNSSLLRTSGAENWASALFCGVYVRFQFTTTSSQLRTRQSARTSGAIPLLSATFYVPSSSHAVTLWRVGPSLFRFLYPLNYMRLSETVLAIDNQPAAIQILQYARELSPLGDPPLGASVIAISARAFEAHPSSSPYAAALEIERKQSVPPLLLI